MEIHDQIQVREAGPEDAETIAGLVKELARAMGESSPLTEDYVHYYLDFPNCYAFIAEQGGKACGLLSYTIRPNLYHAGDTALIEELVVQESARGRGAGHALVEALLRRLRDSGCVEVSVTTMPDNEGAIRFYRAHGLVDEAVYLEKHF